MLTLALVPIVPSLSEGGADRPLPQGGLWPKEGCVGLLSRVSVAGATALLCPLCSGFLLPFFYYCFLCGILAKKLILSYHILRPFPQPIRPSGEGSGIEEVFRIFGQCSRLLSSL